VRATWRKDVAETRPGTLKAPLEPEICKAFLLYKGTFPRRLRNTSCSCFLVLLHVDVSPLPGNVLPYVLSQCSISSCFISLQCSFWGECIHRHGFLQRPTLSGSPSKFLSDSFYDTYALWQRTGRQSHELQNTSQKAWICINLDYYVEIWYSFT
jgi:hypothetical protein